MAGSERVEANSGERARKRRTGFWIAAIVLGLGTCVLLPLACALGMAFLAVEPAPAPEAPAAAPQEDPLEYLIDPSYEERAEEALELAPEDRVPEDPVLQDSESG